MADIEKVKQGCKCCSTDEYKCNECPYWSFGVYTNICTGYVEICADALSVIEQMEQEIERLKAKQQPMIAKGINGTFGSGIGYCPSCGNGMHYANYPGQLTQHYCDQCGQAVKW